MSDSNKPKIVSGNTGGQLTNQLYSYNQSLFSYNESGMEYGGFYGPSSFSKPIIVQGKLKGPTIRFGNTSGKVYSQGLTYNESAVSYNELGVIYGGLYGPSYGDKPVLSGKSNAPSIKFGNTNSSVYNQNITYNQANLSYNQTGYAYGGIYGNTYGNKPTILKGKDNSGTLSVVSGSPIGLLMAITHC